MNDFYKSHSKRESYNIFIVYITEAHAIDVWPIGESAGEIVESHKNINDRIKAATNFTKKFNVDIPIYVDNMDNTYEKEFSSWPVRYHVIKNKKILKIGYPTDAEIDVCELFDFLNNM